MDKSPLHIIKVGGSILADPQRSADLFKAFANLNSTKILVHGGGHQANNWLQRLNIRPQKINGRRITDAQTLEVIKMVYSGLNKEVVAQLNALGARAIGLCGADASIIRAHKRAVREIDYGYAGDIDAIDSPSIRQLLLAGMDLVFSPLTFQSDGFLLNTNADTIASQLAIALSTDYSVDLQFISDVPGVLKDPSSLSSRIETLNAETYRIFKGSGIITGGMIPKIDNAMEGLQKGIHCIYISDHIIHPSHESGGTKITL